MPEKKETKQESSWHYVNERSLRGFHGEVIRSETRFYEDKKDPTGNYRENTSLFVERFTEEGALLESRVFNLENDLVYGVTNPSPYSFYSAEATYDRGSDPKWYGYYEKDGKGLVLKETIESTLSNGSSQVEYECLHQFDVAGRRTVRNCKEPSGTTAESIVMAYDAKGRILTREQKGSILEDLDLRPGVSWREATGLAPNQNFQFRESYTYSSDNDFTLDRTRSRDPEIAIQRMIFKDSLMVSVFHLGPAGDTLGSELYAYDEHRNVLEMKLDYDPWMASWKWSNAYRYEYDSQGNWTSRLQYFVQFDSEQLQQEEKREITYR